MTGPVWSTGDVEDFRSGLAWAEHALGEIARSTS
jgi:hypothetical protein